MKNLKVKTINYLFVLFVLFLTINVGISESKKDNLHSINSKIYYVGTIAVSPDGSKLASGSTDGTIKIWNTTSKSVMKTITINSSYSTDTFYSPYFITNDPRTQQSLLFSDNGTTLLVALTLISTNTIDLVQYDVNTGEELKSYELLMLFMGWVYSINMLVNGSRNQIRAPNPFCVCEEDKKKPSLERNQQFLRLKDLITADDVNRTINGSYANDTNIPFNPFPQNPYSNSVRSTDTNMNTINPITTNPNSSHVVPNYGNFQDIHQLMYNHQMEDGFQSELVRFPCKLFL